MLKVKEVTKKYVSKRGNECNALQGVTFNLPEKGLFFILGKSGSGKSTLLNLLSGLDKCTGGEIVLNGINITEMDAAQLDVYRNEFLGFIFQEFNLIENLSVGENVSLALSLQNRKSVEGEVEKALNEVDLNGMSGRFPDELSGGQKQRVAIARALIKNPRIIFADEPTGNLDSETGKDIFELLVSLSKSKLVIVVSHDEESAEKYGDGIIELKDGKIIKNTCGTIDDVRDEPADLKAYRTKLPDRLAFKMGVSNLLKKKVRSISCILIAVLTILSIAVSQLILSYTPEYSIYRQAKKDGISHIVLEQGEKTFFGIEPGADEISQSTLAHIKDKWTAGFVTKTDSDDVYIESANDLLAAGFEFVGEYLPLDENSFYMSEEYLQELLNESYENRCYIYEDGEFIKIDKSLHNKHNLVGKPIYFDRYYEPSLDRSSVIAGIIATAENNCTPDISELYEKEISWNSFVNGDKFYIQGHLKQLNLTYNGGSRNGLGQKFEITSASSSGQFITNDKLQVYSTTGKSDIFNTILSIGEVYGENGKVNSVADIVLADNEVIVSYDIYRQMFPDAKDVYYYAAYAPEHINEKISLSFKESETGYVCKTYENLILKGFSFNFNPQENIYKVVLGQNNVTELYYDTVSSEALIVNISNIDNLHGFLKDLRTKNVNAYVVNSDFFYGFEETCGQFGLIFVGLSCALSILLLLFVINLISVSIKNQKKEIGILRALGARSRDIFKIFIFESMLLAVIPCIVCFGGAFICAWLLNKVFTAGYIYM